MTTSKFNITADSTPDFDEWGIDDYWSAADWIAWHKLLVAKYGSETANNILIEYYHQASMFASSYNFRTNDAEFISYARSQGFYDGLFAGVLGTIMRPVSVVGDVVNTSVKSVSSVVSYLEIVLPLIMVALVLILCYKGYKYAVA